KPVTSADVAKRIVRGRLHCLDIDDRDASLRVLHDDVEHPFAIRYALFRHAAQIDPAEHRAILGVNHSRIFRRMTEHVDSVVEGIEDNAVWSGARSHRDGLDQLHPLGIEHLGRSAARGVYTYRSSYAVDLNPL